MITRKYRLLLSVLICFGLVFIFLAVLFLFFFEAEEYSEPLRFSSNFDINDPNNALRNIPRRIFQTVSKHEDYILRPKIKQAVESVKMFVHEHNKRCDSSVKGSCFEHMILSDQERDLWIRTHYPKYDSFNRNITYGVQQTDFWRYLVVYHYGGYYLDSDVELRQPIDEWFTLNQTNGTYIRMLIGIEGDRSRGKSYNHHSRSWLRQQILSWTVGGEAKHPFLEHMINRMLVKKPTEKNPDRFEYVVGDFAGPQELTRNVDGYIKKATSGKMNLSSVFALGGNSMVADDMFVAEVSAFSCQNKWSIGAMERGCDQRYSKKNYKRIKVRHLFDGGWKVRPSKWRHVLLTILLLGVLSVLFVRYFRRIRYYVSHKLR